MLKRRFQHSRFFCDIKDLLTKSALLRQASSLLDLENRDQTKYHAFDDEKENQTSKSNNWLSDLLISISTTAEFMVISDGLDMVAAIELKTSSNNEYHIRRLNITCQDEDFVTSVLCLPIMSSQQTGTVDWHAILVGFSSGHTKFYDEQSSCLMSLRFHEDKVINLRLQTLRQNTNAKSETHFSTIPEELTIVHKNCAIAIDGLGLCENLTMAKKERDAGNNQQPVYEAMSLPCIMTCKRWTLETSSCDCENFGVKKRSIFDTLVSKSISQEYDTTKSCGQMMVTTGQSPFIACYRESKTCTVHSYSEWIGSIFSIWKQKPAASKIQMIDFTTPNSLEIKDKERLGTSIISSPDKRLAVTTDNFGRVILLDVTNWIAVRIWKGYRYAQCGWIEAPRDKNEAKCQRALFLVIYAPKRGLIEIWSIQRGPRIAAFNVGKDCLLLYNNHKMLNMRAESLIHGNYSSNCFLLNPNDKSIYTIEVPYSCSLSRESDLSSRDNLLLSELKNASNQDEDSDLCEILFKIVLVESKMRAIHQLTTMSSLSHESLSMFLVEFREHILNQYNDNIVDTDDSSKVTTELPYDIMTAEELSMIELLERVIKLCELFKRLSARKNETSDYSKLSKYNEQPEGIDELAEKLGWTASEVARSVSLSALQQSFRCELDDSPWPIMGEPLSWDEFVSCFDLTVSVNTTHSTNTKPHVQLRLRRLDAEFLNTTAVIKTSSSMYPELFSTHAIDGYEYIDPASRLTMLYQFWLSSRLCNYWKTWQNLQQLTSLISDDLRIASAKLPSGESYLINAWKLVYNLILESDNLFASIIATATVKNETLRFIHEGTSPSITLDSVDNKTISSSWENLYIDAERLALLNAQLEDVFFLSLLLHYSLKEERLVNRHIYKVRKISVSTILRGGPTLVSELVAQWAVQTDLTTHTNLRMFIETGENEIEQPLELLHHVKTSFPNSLTPDILYMYIFWEYCSLWSSNPTVNNISVLDKSIDCLILFNSTKLRHKLALLAWKTFFQTRLERLSILFETKAARVRDGIIKKELNMSEDCLDGFARFCSELTELMLQTHMLAKIETMPVFKQDDWWPRDSLSHTLLSDATSANLVDSELLVILNRLCTILHIVISLKLTKAYPIELIGSEAKQMLRFDLQGESRSRYEPIDDLRNKFALKCISAIAAATKLTDHQFNIIDDLDVATIQYNSSNLSNKSAKYPDHKDRDLPMILFAHVITLCKEWNLDSDLMHRELVVRLYRQGNKDKLAEQISSRIEDQATLSKSLLKIASQRILAVVGLSPYLNVEWRKNTENWSLFQPNVCTWLKSVQQEERERELDSLNDEDASSLVLTKIRTILERITNYLDGQAERLAYNLIESLDALKDFEIVNAKTTSDSNSD